MFAFSTFLLCSGLEFLTTDVCENSFERVQHRIDCKSLCGKSEGRCKQNKKRKKNCNFFVGKNEGTISVAATRFQVDRYCKIIE